jgi:hypothetical protein
MLPKSKDWIDVLNFIVLIFALIAAGIAAYWNVKQAESTERQAIAAQAQNKLAQDIGQRQVKAYVIFDEAALKFSDDKSAYFIEVRVKNSGTTPAFNLIHSWKSEVVPHKSIEATLEPCDPAEGRESYDLAGSKDIGLGDHRRFRLAEGQHESIKKGELTILVSACLRYIDSFRNKQFGYFKLVNGFTPNQSQQSEEAQKMRLFFHSMSDH